MNKIHIIYLAISILLLSGCAIVRPGEAGIKTTLGKVDDKVLAQGPKLYFPSLPGSLNYRYALRTLRSQWIFLQGRTYHQV